MIVDVNILIYARTPDTPEHDVARAWLEGALNGPARVGLPWTSLIGFARIATNPRSARQPLTPDEAMAQIAAWLDAPAAWIPTETDDHATVLSDLVLRHRITGDLMPDAHLAALAIQYGVEVVSTDGDFARFPEIRWINPLAKG